MRDISHIHTLAFFKVIRSFNGDEIIYFQPTLHYFSKTRDLTEGIQMYFQCRLFLCIGYGFHNSAVVTAEHFHTFQHLIIVLQQKEKCGGGI